MIQHLESDDAILTVNRLSVHFGDRRVLADVNFHINAGEFTGLIGSNGSGKTTLFRAILGMLTPASGSISVASLSHVDTSRTIGYVPQKITLDPELPLCARDVVSLGLDGHRFGWQRSRRDRDHLVDEMLDAVDATQFASRRVGRLSGGEQQRVLLAHALISRPRLILLDEPLANLDPGSVDEIVALLARIVRDQKVAVLISAHDMNPMLPVMDRIIYVANGHATSGSVTEVVQPQVLSALYGHHVDVVHLHGRIFVVVGSSVAESAHVADHDRLVFE